MEIQFHDSRKELYELSKKIAICHHKIQQEFPLWKKEDARLIFYTRTLNTVEMVLFSKIFEEEQLQDQNWYSKIPYLKTPSLSQIKTTQEIYELNLRVVLVTFFFSSLESFLRIIFKKIFPSSKEKQIFKIVEILLEHFDMKTYQRIFDLYRFLRNSLHNNGIIDDKFAYPILYQGIFYNFRYGESIQVNWLMLCQTTSDLEECINKIIHSDEIREMDYIKDKSYFDTNDVTYLHFESM